MKCPKCNTKMLIMQVLENSEHEVYRYLSCPECDHEIYTMEFEIEVTKEFKKEWRELQKAEVKDPITPVTDHYGYRCEVFQRQYIYVVYHIKEATMPDGKIDRSKARGYFMNSFLAERECRFLEKMVSIEVKDDKN